MLDKVRLCVLAGAWSPYADRFLPVSGQPKPTVGECIAAAALIPGLTGIELIHPSQVTPANVQEVKAALVKHGLVAASVAASISSLPCYLSGSLTNDDPDVRRQAIETVKTALDLAEALGTGQITLWLGRDGFDYAFQIDYDLVLGRLMDGLREIASHRPTIRIGIEYKLKEPRRHLLAATATKTLLLISEVGAPNLGVLLDTGHALYAQESLAETVALLSRAGKLFHVHFNDNTRLWDDDMIVGSIHFLEIMEMLHWLDRTGYSGWLSFDPHVMLEDTSQAVAESVAFVQGLIGVLNRIGRAAVEEAIASHQVTHIMALLRRELFAG